MTYDPDSTVGRFLAGQQDAHATVVRWIAQVLTSARFRLLRRDWIDLQQDAIQGILESLHAGRFDASRDFRVYCQSVARYTASAAMTRKLRQLEVQSPAPAAPVVEPAVEERLVTRSLVAAVMGEMSPDCRRLFELLFFEQRSHAEIAQELQVSPVTVRTRLFRCLARARERAEGAGWGRERRPRPVRVERPRATVEGQDP